MSKETTLASSGGYFFRLAFVCFVVVVVVFVLSF